MTKNMKLGWMAIAAMAFLASAASAQDARELNTQKKKASYCLAVDLAKRLKAQGIELDVDAFAKGLTDVTSGRQPLLSNDDIQATLGELFRQAQAKDTTADANLAAGEAFLAANKSKQGVVALPSGLQYKILKQGKGPKPTANDTVECNYRGTLIDGTEFDSSYRRGEPAAFPVSRVIHGWTEALQMMPVGSKWQLFVPAKLAYGPRGMGGVITPNSTLIFEVELLGIK
jgi:FKBP-type peptidyl-prolyl cis-trans isomerase FklB